MAGKNIIYMADCQKIVIPYTMSKLQKLLWQGEIKKCGEISKPPNLIRHN